MDKQYADMEELVKRVLIIEDTHDHATLLASILETKGITADIALSEESALGMFKETYSVIVADIMLPGSKTGVEIAREYARNHSETLVFVFSGHPGHKEYSGARYAYDKSPEGLKALVQDIIRALDDKSNAVHILAGTVQEVKRTLAQNIVVVAAFVTGLSVGVAIGVLVGVCLI